MPTRTDNFHHALQTANAWLTDVAEAFGTDDRRFAYRVLRAWLHTLRDRLTIDSAAKFSAQLPALLRGLYYDGWDPSRAPVKYGPDGYVHRFAQEARISVDEVRPAAASVAGALARHLSPGQLDEAIAQLPEALRTIVNGSTQPARPARPGSLADMSAHERLTVIEEQLGNVTEALRTLAQGLEEDPLAGVGDRRGAKAARLAAEILMAAPQKPAGSTGAGATA